LAKLDGRLDLRAHPELFRLISRPEQVCLSIGQLCENRGRYQEALAMYQKVAEREPNVFDYQAHIADVLASLGRGEEARRLAAELVTGHRASLESVELLRKIYKQIGREGQEVEELRAILKRRPGDRAITFALAE